jgi:hypothetical protein
MGRPRKKAHDLTTEETMKRLFPPKVIRAAKEEAQKSENKPPKPSQEQG